MVLINFYKNNFLKNLFYILFCLLFFYYVKTDKDNSLLSKENNSSSNLISSAVSIAESIILAKELEKLQIEDYPDLIESVNFFFCF